MPFQPSLNSRSLSPEPPPAAPEATHIPGFMTPEEAGSYFSRLRAELEFRPDQLLIHGKLILARRQVDYRADPGAAYEYSGSLQAPAPWTPALQEIRERVERACALKFNACLCNLYESGAVGMGWHADKESELGPRPVIASVSLGAARIFRFRRRQPWRGETRGCQKWSYLLNPGDLLIMSGSTQTHFEHELPPAPRAAGERINLTFRRVRLPPQKN